MPGLQDVHTHLAYGNAKTEEDVDLYQPMEFRALRGLFFAQKVLRRVIHRYVRPATPGRSAFRSGMPSTSVCSTAHGLPRRAVT
jgi:hypothetical protein